MQSIYMYLLNNPAEKNSPRSALSLPLPKKKGDLGLNTVPQPVSQLAMEGIKYM
jgi:hypothetical protein